VVAVVRNITERKLFEAELLQQRTQLRRLASELTVSEERHRRELALQLHDSIGQELAIARLRLQRGAETQGTPEALEHYGAASRLLETSIKQVQALTFEMSPPALHELGLPHALRSYSRHMQKTHGIEIEYEESGEQAKLTGDQKILMFRCARELMANVVKHAEATHILVSLAYEPDEVAVRVEDDGKGFDPRQYLTQSPIDELHFGLFSIRERVAAYGGRLEIKSGEGTVATVSIPLGAGSSTDNDSTRTNPS
jgi:signal transduction histidine kinase